MINETNRVEKLLKGLLSYARPPKLHYEFFDLNTLLDNSIKNISVAGRTSSRQGVEFEKHYTQNLPKLEADSAQLQQIVLNVLLNAIEAMSEGGRISVTTRMHDEESIEMNISDTGKGIPETALTDIFQPFYTTKAKGTGLGLAICKRIIEEHGGTIEASGNPDGGTTFTIILPLIHKPQDILI
jgi:two-component system sensor histidine kinase AtoS